MIYFYLPGNNISNIDCNTGLSARQLDSPQDYGLTRDCILLKIILLNPLYSLLDKIIVRKRGGYIEITIVTGTELDKAG